MRKIHEKWKNGDSDLDLDIHIGGNTDVQVLDRSLLPELSLRGKYPYSWRWTKLMMQPPIPSYPLVNKHTRNTDTN